ncbi:hypothetical protein [Virgisporangium ochraceum]|nr:hypothetical protein [Virgisporangium ochraceum]
MTSYPFQPGQIPFSRRRPTSDGPSRPARRIALDVRRRPERHHSPW